MISKLTGREVVTDTYRRYEIAFDSIGFMYRPLYSSTWYSTPKQAEAAIARTIIVFGGKPI